MSHQFDAEVISLRARESKGSTANEQSPVQFYIMKWLDLSNDGTAIADEILHDITTDNDDEKQTALKAAIASSVLYDYYDNLLETDLIIPLLEQRTRALVKTGQEMTSTRRALIALMEVRAAEIIVAPDQDIPLQLARLPLGDEDRWRQLIDQLKD